MMMTTRTMMMMMILVFVCLSGCSFFRESKSCLLVTYVPCAVDMLIK